MGRKPFSTAQKIANGDKNPQRINRNEPKLFKVKPATLKLLMRHQQIETTMRYYVDQDADDIADQLWKLHGVGTCVGTSSILQDDGAEKRPQVIDDSRL